MYHHAFPFPIKHVKSRQNAAISNALAKAAEAKPMGRTPDAARGDIQDTLRLLSQKISNAEHLQSPVKCNLCRQDVVPGMTVCWFCTGEVIYGSLEASVAEDFNMADEDSVARLAARYIASATWGSSTPCGCWT